MMLTFEDFCLRHDATEEERQALAFHLAFLRMRPILTWLIEVSRHGH